MDIYIENQSVTLSHGGTLRVHDEVLETSDMEPGSVLIKTLLSEVCGTDVHLRHGRLNLVPSPIIPGHVSVGTVCRVAGVVRDAEGQPLERGTVVTFLDVIGTCNSCLTCLVEKQTTRCPARRVIGITCQADPARITGLLGGWSTHIYLPPGSQVIRLPAGLPPRTFMAGGCGLPTAMHAIERAGVRIMDTVVVLGSGPVGLLAALLARHSGAGQVIVVGAPEHRLAVVRKFGIEATIDIQEISSADERLKVLLSLTGGRLADVVIEATGQPVAVQQGMDMCRNGGTFVVVGQYTDNGDISINPHLQINRKHLTVKGCWGSDFSHFCRGVRFMEKTARALPWELCLSREFSLGEAAQALDAVESLQVFKALIKP